MARPHGVKKAEVAVYDRNRRETIQKGTVEVSVVSTVLSQTLDGRKQAEDRARRYAVETYVTEYGQPPRPDRCVITHYHVTCQIVTTLRVDPE